MMCFPLVLVSVHIVQSFQTFAQLADCTIKYTFLPETHDDSTSLPASEVAFGKKDFVVLRES